VTVVVIQVLLRILSGKFADTVIAAASCVAVLVP
jgi:hypothetical protein